MMIAELFVIKSTPRRQNENLQRLVSVCLFILIDRFFVFGIDSSPSERPQIGLIPGLLGHTKQFRHAMQYDSDRQDRKREYTGSQPLLVCPVGGVY